MRNLLNCNWSKRFLFQLVSSVHHGLNFALFDLECRETFVNTFMLQIAVLSNHLNGRDTHVRQIKIYGPRLCVVFSNPLFLFLASDYYTVISLSVKFFLQEPYSSSAISLYFKGVYYLFYSEMRNVGLLWQKIQVIRSCFWC